MEHIPTLALGTMEISDGGQAKELLELLDNFKVEVNRDCELEIAAEDKEYRKKITYS